MCDETTEREARGWSRREFATLSAASLAWLAVSDAEAGMLVESEVVIDTADGKADAYFVHPAGVSSPGVLIWPDILGLRPAFRAMAKRLAADGYAVLVVNPFYRSAKAPVVAEGASFADPAVREHVLPMAKKLSAATAAVDAPTLVGFLDASDAVDATRGIGTTGYCMGGPLVLRTAGLLPERIAAAASFHGGGLVTEDPDSPHRSIAKSRARALVAIAENDDTRGPKDKTVLREAYAAAELEAEVEVYAGAMHGWCLPDSRAHDEAAAEKAWKRLGVLLTAALKS